MAIPTDDFTNPLHLLMASCMGLLGISGWFARRALKRMDQDIADARKDIGDLKDNRVTKDDFDELRGSMVASIKEAFGQVSQGIERRHQENRDDRTTMMSGIRSEIDSVRQDVREMWRAFNGRSS